MSWVRVSENPRLASAQRTAAHTSASPRADFRHPGPRLAGSGVWNNSHTAETDGFDMRRSVGIVTQLPKRFLPQFLPQFPNVSSAEAVCGSVGVDWMLAGIRPATSDCLFRL